MKIPRFAVWTGVIAVALVLAIPLYLAAWGVIYRIPAAPPTVIDRRLSASDQAYYVAFCSSLADGTPLGYPGHCYVVWSRKLPLDFPNAESASFVPRYARDQIPSLFKTVPGLLVRDAWRGNLRNFNSLTVIVSAREFERTRAIRDSWSPDVFRVGVRDCVTFTDTLAQAVGIKTPGASYKYPQDYLRELKQRN